MLHVVDQLFHFFPYQFVAQLLFQEFLSFGRSFWWYSCCLSGFIHSLYSAKVLCSIRFTFFLLRSLFFFRSSSFRGGLYFLGSSGGSSCNLWALGYCIKFQFLQSQNFGTFGGHPIRESHQLVFLFDHKFDVCFSRKKQALRHLVLLFFSWFLWVSSLLVAVFRRVLCHRSQNAVYSWKGLFF